MPRVEVTRTYLEMSSPGDLVAASSPDPRLRLERVEECPASFHRYLYAEVGRAYHWVDRLGWTDEQTLAYLASPAVGLWVLYCAGAPAGYFELKRDDDGSAEGARRVWLHTCTLDHPAALPNYVARGFRPFKTERYVTETP